MLIKTLKHKQNKKVDGQIYHVLTAYMNCFAIMQIYIPPKFLNIIRISSFPLQVQAVL